jgi:hypothetical protein
VSILRRAPHCRPLLQSKCCTHAHVHARSKWPSIRSIATYTLLRFYPHIFALTRRFSGVGKYYEFTDSLREPWARPPVKRIICAYGTGIKTPIHSTYVPYVNGTAGYVRTRTVYEERDQHFEVLHGYTSDTELWRHQVTEKPGLRKAVKPGDDASAEPEYVQLCSSFQLLLTKLHLQICVRSLAFKCLLFPSSFFLVRMFGARYVYHRPPTSGDGTAPYDSLSWCHNWLSPTGQVSVTTVPQDRYALIGLAETKRSHASRRNGNGGKPIDIGASMPFQKSGKASLPEGGAYAFTPGDAVNVFYEEAHCGPRGTCASTSVWELDGQVGGPCVRSFESFVLPFIRIHMWIVADQICKLMAALIVGALSLH